MTSQNTINRKKQRDMHTTGRKSFARTREGIKIQNPTKEQPSQLDIFKATHKRKSDRVYKDSDGVISQQIAQLEAIQSQGEVSSGQTVAFAHVLEEEHSGRGKLYGRGVNPTALRGKKVAEDVVEVVPAEFMRSMREYIEVEVEKKFKAWKPALLQELFDMIVSALQQSNPGLNFNVNLSTLCFPGAPSPCGAPGAQNQQNQSVLDQSSSGSYSPPEQDEGDDQESEARKLWFVPY